MTVKNTVKSHDLKAGFHSSHAGSSVLSKALHRSHEDEGRSRKEITAKGIRKAVLMYIRNIVSRKIKEKKIKKKILGLKILPGIGMQIARDMKKYANEKIGLSKIVRL